MENIKEQELNKKNIIDQNDLNSIYKNAYKEANKKTIVFSSKYLFNKQNSKNLANEIRKNHDIFNNTELLKTYHNKIVSHAQMLRDVLTYEFLFYEPDEKIEMVNTIDDLLKICIEELKKYQGIVEGYKIEDNDWLPINTNNARFKLKKSQVGIYNSVNREDCFDVNLTWFLKKFTIHMKKFIKCNYINFDYKLFDDESNSIGWIVFVCENESLNNNISNIESDFDSNYDTDDFIDEIKNSTN